MRTIAGNRFRAQTPVPAHEVHFLNESFIGRLCLGRKSQPDPRQRAHIFMIVSPRFATPVKATT